MAVNLLPRLIPELSTLKSWQENFGDIFVVPIDIRYTLGPVLDDLFFNFAIDPIYYQISN